MQFLILQLSYQEKSNFLFLQKLKLNKTTTTKNFSLWYHYYDFFYCHEHSSYIYTCTLRLEFCMLRVHVRLLSYILYGTKWCLLTVSLQKEARFALCHWRNESVSSDISSSLATLNDVTWLILGFELYIFPLLGDRHL